MGGMAGGVARGYRGTGLTFSGGLATKDDQLLTKTFDKWLLRRMPQRIWTYGEKLSCSLAIQVQAITSSANYLLFISFAASWVPT